MSSSMQSSVMANKFVFEQMISVVQNVHKKIVIMEGDNTINYCLKQLHQLHKNAEKGFEKRYYNRLINEICDYIHLQCDASKADIYETWMKVVFDASNMLTPKDITIYNYFKSFFFGDVQIYEIIFEHNDRKSRKGRYYYVMRLMFNKDTENVLKLQVSIQDLKHKTFTDFDKGSLMIKGATMSEDGYITFDVSNNTLLELSKYCYEEFNNHGFQGGFELYPKISMDIKYNEYITKNKNNILQEYFNDYLVTNHFNNKLHEVFLPF